MRLKPRWIDADRFPDWTALARLHGASFAPPRRAWRAAEIAALAAEGGCCVVGAPPAGFALARVAGGEAELLTLAVAPGARRRGLGGALVEAVCAWAAAAGAKALFLEVAADATGARALYAAAGFAEVGVRQGYYSPTLHAHVLRRPLQLSADDTM